MSGLADKGKSSEDPNLKHAREAQKYFDNYAPVLIFGILSLAVQSVVWRHDFADYFNIGAFVLILVAGIVSLWRLERLPKFYVNAAEVNEATAERNFLVKAIAGGKKDQGYSDWLASVGKRLEFSGNIEISEQKWSKRTYQVQKWSFVIGLVLLLIARCIPAFCR
jgi:hypothetical protein